MSSALFGWDLLIKSVESEIKTNQDVLLCFTHLVLISNGFKCIDLGESKVLEGTENKTEALPPGWSESYAIRYVYQGRLYNLKCTKLDDAVMINLIRVDERTTSLVQLSNNQVASRSGGLDQMIPKYSEMAEMIKTQLIEKLIVSKKSKETSSQTESPNQSRPTAQYIPPGHSPLMVDPVGGPLIGPHRPVGIGEIDLNPFGRNPLGFPAPMGGGGMLFEPPRGGRFPQQPGFGMPPGAVPPGARFDPFRPPDADRFPRRPNNRPDNDELPPPGYDDMFM